MGNSIIEKIGLMEKVFGGIDVADMGADSTETVVSNINHKYREQVVLPYIAITNNIRFLLTNGDRYVVTNDNVTCKVESLKEVHICELEKVIQELYNIDCWTFIKKWYAAKGSIGSMYFVYMKLKKQ